MNEWKKHIRVIQSGGIFNVSKLDGIDLYNVEDVEELFRRLKAHLLQEELIDDLSDIDLIWLNDEKINAFVITSNGKYGICISIKMIKAIWNLLLLALCDPEILANYHNDHKINYDCEKKISRLLLFGPAIIPAYNYDRDRDADTPGIYQNITDSRRELCEILFNTIMDFILYHEAMHITRDHLSFLSVYNSETHIDEAKIFSESNIKILQFLEMDADVAALNLCVQSYPEFKEINQLSQSEKKDFFFMEIFGYLIVQQLFDFDSDYKEIKQQLNGSHPPPVFRGLLWSNLLRQIFKKYQIIDEEMVKDQQNKAWWEASQIAVKLSFPAGRWHGDNMNDVSFPLIDQIIDEFNLFQDIIERSHTSGNYDEFRSYIKSM